MTWTTPSRSAVTPPANCSSTAARATTCCPVKPAMTFSLVGRATTSSTAGRATTPSSSNRALRRESGSHRPAPPARAGSCWQTGRRRFFLADSRRDGDWLRRRRAAPGEEGGVRSATHSRRSCSTTPEGRACARTRCAPGKGALQPRYLIPTEKEHLMLRRFWRNAVHQLFARRPRALRRYTPNPEALNERIVPAVTATFTPGAGTLTVIGDNLDNTITVSR